MSNAKPTFEGSIVDIRAVEDCIRATRKYTEGIQTIRKAHPIQGGAFPSQSFHKVYEVYPTVDLEEKLPIGKAISTAMDWLWCDVPCVNVQFRYDYRTDKAVVVIKGGQKSVKALTKGIPGFSESLARAIARTYDTQNAQHEPQPVVDGPDRVGAGTIPRP